ncbi:MAG: NADP-dependent phosphogluconate dehydrogenase [Thaumarchaeota archaeon]|nr:NADP-dependent phosphogluconate dehydrogenase [Candidatus Calditenuaceae archaeon]MDW8187005.1 NADP-dependent phosphogluconate dehydrogenase [Nitrososphaerota archaeon]
MRESDVGVYGLGAMGEGFALNLASKGLRVSVYNRTAERTREFVSRHVKEDQIKPTYSVEEFVKSLDRPRRIFVFVKAGPAVDEVLSSLLPHLENGDVIVDCGNSHFRDSDRRHGELGSKSIEFVGMGVSGGYEGALRGPSLMAGGSIRGYSELEGVLRDIAAKFQGDPCAGYFGPGGGGHLVKTVHNGIEYALMGAVAETYHLLKAALRLGNDELSDLFRDWSRGELSSFLVEATAEVLAYREGGEELLEKVLDVAEQKGTGIWTSQLSLELGVSAPSIDEAVHYRFVSAMKDLRSKYSRHSCALTSGGKLDREEVIESAKRSLYLSHLSSYLQGLTLLYESSKHLRYGFDPSEAFRVWRAGCIIRSRIVERAYSAFRSSEGERPEQFLEEFSGDFRSGMVYWRNFVVLAVQLGVPVPVTSSALNWFNSITSRWIAANVVQALRDYFGRHGFYRVDRPGTFTSNWGRGV